MPSKILFVPYQMFPIPALPYAALALGNLAGRAFLSGRQLAGKFGFDQTPARGKIRVTRRQCPDGVQVVRQNDNGFHREGMAVMRVSEGVFQQPDVFGQQCLATVGKVDREEIAGSRNIGATVAWSWFVGLCLMGIAALHPSYSRWTAERLEHLGQISLSLSRTGVMNSGEKMQRA